MFTDLTTLEQVKARFHSEEACADYLFAQKWPKGFICSRCSHTTAYRLDIRRLPLYQCVHCHYQASPTVGTVMQSSSTSLHKWFIALFLVSSTESGINALRLKEVINVTYKTAWLMLRKIRQSITQVSSEDKLTGTVHVDKAKCGKPWSSSFYLNAEDFPVLVGTATDQHGHPTNVKIQMLPKFHYNETNILPEGIRAFRDKHIEEGAEVTYTIGTRISRKSMKGYPIFQKARTWIKETYHGLGQHHLQQYWNEFCWRENARLQNISPYRLMIGLCVTTPSTTYAKLVRERCIIA